MTNSQFKGRPHRTHFHLYFPITYSRNEYETELKHFPLRLCVGFGWDRGNFLHSSWYGAAFRIFVLKTVLITQMFSLLLHCTYTECKTFFASHPTPATNWLEVHKLRGDSWPKEYPIWHHAQHIKTGRRRKEKTFRVMVFVFPSNHHMWWIPAFLETAKHLPAHGKW